MISINVTILFQLVNFFIGLLIINHFIIKPIRQIIAKRNSAFNNLEEEAKKLQHKADSQLHEYEERLLHVRREMAHEKDKLKHIAEQKAHEIQNQASEEARLLKVNAQEVRAKEGQNAYASLQKHVKQYADEAFERLVKAS